MEKIMKKIVSCILIVLTAVVLVACGTSVKDQEKNLVGVWSGESGTLTLYDNKKAATSFDGYDIDGTWSIKDGKLYVTRDSHSDLQATLPDGEFSSLEVVWIGKSTGKPFGESEMFMKEQSDKKTGSANADRRFFVAKFIKI